SSSNTIWRLSRPLIGSSTLARKVEMAVESWLRPARLKISFESRAATPVSFSRSFLSVGPAQVDAWPQNNPLGSRDVLVRVPVRSSQRERKSGMAHKNNQALEGVP